MKNCLDCYAINIELTNKSEGDFAGDKCCPEEKDVSWYGVYGKMCVTVGDDELIVRIDPSFHETAINRKGARTVVMKGRDYIGWVLVKESNLKSKKVLRYWINLALAYNRIII